MDSVIVSLPLAAFEELDYRLEIIREDGYEVAWNTVRSYKALGRTVAKARAKRGYTRKGPPVKLAVSPAQLRLIREELEWAAGSDLEGDTLRAVTLVTRRIEHFEQHGSWPDRPRKPAAVHSPDLRAEAERVVREAIKECCRIARRKSSELDLPSNWKPNLKVSWSPNRSSSWGGRHHRATEGLYSGHGGVSLALYRYVPADGQGGGVWEEYARIAKEPVIGNFVTQDWRNVVRALVAHEVAHAIQYYRYRHAPLRDRAKYKKPHGHGWQQVYALLRHNTVNPRLKAEAKAIA